MSGPTEFDIRVNALDEYEVIAMEPAVLGTFGAREHAELFYGALVNDDATITDFDEGMGITIEDAEAALEPVSQEAADVREHVVPSLKKAKKQLDADAQRKLSTVAQPPQDEPALTAPTEEDYQVALSRMEQGERCKDVARDMHLDFNKLRGLWAAAVTRGERKHPAPPKISKQTSSKRAEADDSPVSGGVGAVLSSGVKKRQWTDEQDAALLEADPADMKRLAKSFNRSEADLTERKEALEAATAKLMQGGDDG